MLTRRDFLKSAASTSAGVMIAPDLIMRIGYTGRPFLAAIPVAGGNLDPTLIQKYVTPLVKPPAMPKSRGSNRNKHKYKIAMRQFDQQILPPGNPKTTVWSYGSVDYPGMVGVGDGTFYYPALTIEAEADKTVQVQWINDLVDGNGNFLPHLLPIDQTLHWANPPGGTADRDRRGSDPNRYQGPVPMVTHVHGAHTTEDSDGYPEAWYLPNAANIPGGYATTGTFYDYYKTKYGHGWTPGLATFKYPNDQPATTLWYHDHTLGMTRANVYAGPAGFWLIRGGPHDADLGYRAPKAGEDPFDDKYTEIPIVIQDRSFNSDGSLFYPDNRAFFEGLDPADLQIPFTPDPGCDGEPSDVAPIWNPEFFGNTMVVNGSTWPSLTVKRRRYRFRFLNGCNSRFLILEASNGMAFHQIGGDQGFLPAPVALDSLLLAPAERADVIMDFSNVPEGTEVVLLNVGPDEPYGGGEPGVDFDAADPDTTGQVMKFVVDGNRDRRENPGWDPTTTVPWTAAPMPGASTNTRQISLNEEESRNVLASDGPGGTIVADCAGGAPFGPTSALLGTYDPATDASTPMLWMDPVTENPAVGAVETWEIYNFTEDAHPIHIHQVHFEVVGRDGRGPEDWETGYKDTVIAYPGEVTRVKALFDLPGFYVWHCHIVEHEDNEMMRPMHVGPIPPDAPAQ